MNLIQSFQRYPTVSNGIQRYPTVSNGIQRYPTVSGMVSRNQFIRIDHFNVIVQ